ncbi:MAG TPA: glycosyl hydrolase family 28-related protein [Candidatus Limnocylindrales bacterium]
MGTVNRRHLLRSAGIAGIATAAVGAAGTPGHAAPLNPAGATTPQDFGAVGDGVADDTNAIQQAIDAQLNKANKVVYFPPGTYRITRTVVVPDLEGAGGPHFNRLVLAGAGTMGSRTSIIKVDFNGTGILLRAPLAAVRGIAFVVAPSLNNSQAIHIARDPAATKANTDDMDATITECTFIDFFRAVKQVGRGLVFTNNLVAVGDIGLDISWPTAGVSGTGVHLLPYGMRKWLIEGNHFHSMGTAIVTTGADAHNFRGAIIANNILDIGRRFFSGGIVNSTFAGNVVEQGSNGSVVAITAGGTNLTFTGNIFGGGEPTGGGRPSHGIEFRPEATARNVTITGNSFNWVLGSPVYFAASASEITIASNSFDNWNLDADERWGGVRINGDADSVSLIGNLFGANPVATSAPIRVIGAISGSTIVGNTFDGTVGVLYAGKLGIGNYIEKRSAGANHHELTAAVNGSLVVRSTSDTPVVGTDAYGSFVAAGGNANPGVKGGVRVAPVNGTGSAVTELLCATNSTNAVVSMAAGINGLVPPVDNARDLGSADNHMRAVYTHRMVLAEHAPGALPAAAENAGGIILVRDPHTNRRRLAFSDGSAWRDVTLGAGF